MNASARFPRRFAYTLIAVPPLAVLAALAGQRAIPVARSQEAPPPVRSGRVAFEPLATVGGMAWSVDVEGSVAHVGSFRDDATVLTSWDLAARPAPRLVGTSAPLPGRIGDVVVSGPAALTRLQRGSGGLVPHWTAADVRVLDVADPRRALELAALDSPSSESWSGIDLQEAVGCLASTRDGVWIYAFDDPTGPRELARFTTPFADPARCALQHPYVYTTSHADDEVRLDIHDLRDASGAPPVGRASERPGGGPGPAVADLVVTDGHVLASGAPFWLWNVDVTDASAPRTAALVPADGYVPTTVVVSGTVAYVAAGEGAGAWPYPLGDPLRPWASVGLLRAYDVADPAAPRLLGEARIRGLPSGIAVWGDEVLVAAGNAGLHIFRVAEIPTTASSSIYLPSAARGASRPVPDPDIVQIGGAATAMVVAGQTAYVGLGASLQVMDIRDPRALKVVSQTAVLPAAVRDVAFSGHHAYALLDRASQWWSTGSASWLAAIDVRDPKHPVLSSCQPIGQGGTALAATDGLVVVARGGESALTVFEDRAGGAPKAVGEVEIAYAVDLAATGRSAYVLQVGQLRVIDLADPAHPTVVASVSMPFPGYYARLLTLDGDRAYVTGAAEDDGANELVVLDVSRPMEPRVLGRISLDAARGVAARGGLAVLVGDVVQTVDVSDGAQPRLMAVEGATDARGLAAASFGPTGQAVVYAIAVDVGIRVYDVGRPGQPTSIAFMPAAAISDVALEDDVLAAAAGTGLAVFETRPDGAPVRIASLAADRWVAAVALDRAWRQGAPPGDAADRLMGYAALGDAEHVAKHPYGGLMQVDLTDPSAPRATRTIDTQEPAVDLAVDPGVVALAETSGVRIFDLLLRDVVRRGDVRPGRLALRDGTLYGVGTLLYTFEAGLRPITTLPLRGVLTAEGVDLVVNGDALVVADGQRVRVVDATAPGVLREVDSLAESARALAMDPASAVLYAAGDRLARFEVQDPLAPRLLAARELPCRPEAMVVDAAHVYLAAGACGLMVLER